MLRNLILIITLRFLRRHKRLGMKCIVFVLNALLDDKETSMKITRDGNTWLITEGDIAVCGDTLQQALENFQKVIDFRTSITGLKLEYIEGWYRGLTSKD
jgi:hypothetical protein